MKIQFNIRDLRYTDNGRELNKQLSDWLAAVPFESSSSKPVKAIISP